MRAASRIVRLTAAVTAVLLLVSSTLPLVQHVCAMARPTGDAHGAMHDPPPSHGAKHAGTTHDDAPTMPGAAPCSTGTPVGAPHQAHDACCIGAAQTLPDDVVLMPASSLAAPLVAVASRLPADPAALQPASFVDTGPPPPSAPVYLVHSVFLT